MFRTQRRDRTTLHFAPCPRGRLAPWAWSTTRTAGWMSLAVT